MMSRSVDPANRNRPPLRRPRKGLMPSRLRAAAMSRQVASGMVAEDAQHHRRLVAVDLVLAGPSRDKNQINRIERTGIAKTPREHFMRAVDDAPRYPAPVHGNFHASGVQE